MKVPNHSITLLIFLLPRYAISGSVALGGTCSTNNTRVDPATHKLLTDCDEHTFCSTATNGTCQAKLCRRDEFPFGYGPKDVLPPLCTHGTFCPDEGNGCQNLIEVGQPCQMNRDEQCAPPNAQAIGTASSQISDGPVCLSSTCVFANATLGQRCIVDNTTYVDVGPNGQQFGNLIARHNCRSPQFYCDFSALQCFLSKPVDTPCSLSSECRSQNCGVGGLCEETIGIVHTVLPWQYAVTVLSVVTTMCAIVATLVVIHKRLRLNHHRELREYYHEQISLRRSMFALHHHAATSSSHMEKYHELYE